MTNKNIEFLSISYTYNKSNVAESYSIKLEDISMLENLLDVFEHTLEVLGHGKLRLEVSRAPDLGENIDIPKEVWGDGLED